MNEQERKFDGIWIPSDIWLTPDLDIIEKCLLAEINSFSTNGICYASNEHFANFFQCSERKISAGISKLIKMGLVEQVGFDGRKRYLQSRLENFARLQCKICDDNNISNNIYINKENIKRNENVVQSSFLETDENQVQNEKVDLETETPTSTTSLIATNEKQELQQEANKSDEQTDYDKIIDYFEKTWCRYPRKEGKVQAKTTFTHKVFDKDEEISRILARRVYKSLERQIQAWQNENNGAGRDKQYIPFFSSWLNDNFEDVPKKDRGKTK